MLTLVKSADAIPIVGIYRGKKNKKPDPTVYFTNQISEENQNIAPAAPPARVIHSRAVSSRGSDCFFQVTPPRAMPA